MTAQMENLRLLAHDAANMVNTPEGPAEFRLQDVRHRVREIAIHGVRSGAAVALTVASLQSGQDLSFMATGYPLNEDPEDHEEDVEEFANYFEAIALITPERILEKVFDD